MKIKFSGKVYEINENFPENVYELLKRLELSPEEVIVLKDKKVLIENDKLNPDDEIEIIKVISGG
ncbi:MAG: MoaD/ThiS family protein [candidate division WOR-3 bacterium]